MGKEGGKAYEIDEDAEEGDDDDGATDHSSRDESEHYAVCQLRVYVDGDMYDIGVVQARKAATWRVHVCLYLTVIAKKKNAHI